ncbi:MAG: arginine N-succinyltransferase [Myxococcota bacterium]
MDALRYEIRGLTEADGDELLELASYLDSVNLPNDPAFIRPIIELSDRSFREALEPRYREYRFVLYDREEKRVVGSSLIVGQLGRRDAPYIYLKVAEEERYSASLDRHFVHKKLAIGYSYDGPTEIGGLVMHPHYRRSPERLGIQISYVRFLFIAMYRAYFQGHVLAELLPPLEADGRSHLWEAVGRQFTGMNYREADRLSKENKEFIRGLFPDGDIYVSLLSPEAQAVVGKVGPQTRGVEKMLRRIGFRYADRVDPFDGGPHFAARIDEVSLVRNAQSSRVAIHELGVHAQPYMVGVTLDAPPFFRAARVRAERIGNELRLQPAIAEALEIEAGQEVWATPTNLR